jgi:hypothetical protein
MNLFASIQAKLINYNLTMVIKVITHVYFIAYVWLSTPICEPFHNAKTSYCKHFLYNQIAFLNLMINEEK